MVRNYENNEDIILTSKRMFPDKQNMSDPNESKSVFKNGKYRKRRGRMEIPPIVSNTNESNSIIKQAEMRKIEEEMYNSCHRCGENIENDKVFSPKTYGYGLCVPCNTDLERSVRG